MMKSVVFWCMIDREHSLTEPVHGGPEESRVSSGVSRLWWGVLWIATALLCTFIVWDNASSGVDPKDSSQRYPDAAQVSSMQLELMSRYMAGIRTSGLPDAGLPESNTEDMVSEFAVGPTERLRVAMVSAAEGRDVEALVHLIEAERVISERLAEAVPADSAFAEAWASHLRADADVVRSLILTGGGSVEEADIERLEDRHGWFGVAARYAWAGKGSDAEKRYNTDAVQTLVVTLVFVAVAFLACLIGLVLFVVGLVLVVTGRVRSGLNLRVLGVGTPRVAAFEAFVLFLLGFVGVRVGLEILVQGGVIQSSLVLGAVQFVLLWLLLLVTAWPLVRGVSWRDTRVLAGWGVRSPGGALGVSREIGLGVVGYLAGLPIVVFGVLVALILVGMTGGEPTHPAVDGIRSGGVVGIAITFVLATVWAPVVEETVFRGMLYAGIRGPRVVSMIGASALSGFIFAVIHPQGIALVPALMSIGVVMALIREWRGSIVGCITAHAIHNGMLVSMVLLALG